MKYGKVHAQRLLTLPLFDPASFFLVVHQSKSNRKREGKGK